jgi:hypothetical protein
MAAAGHFSRACTRLGGRRAGVWLIVAAAITWLIVFGRLGSSSSLFQAKQLRSVDA